MLQHPSFKAQISSWWNIPMQGRWEGFRFMGKLRALQGKLRSWNKEVFGDVRVQKKEIWII